MIRIHRRLPKGDGGIGLITVLLVTAIGSALIVIAFGMAQRSLDQSGRHVAYEQSVHAAEQGIDQTLARLNKARTWNCGPVAPAFTTQDQEEVWARAAIAEVQLSGACATQSTPQGTFVAIRPANRNVIYSLGVSGRGSHQEKERLLKAEFLFSTYSPSHAVLTGGDLTINGNPTIGGLFADIHSNEDISITGGSATLPGVITASGIAALNGQGATGSGGGTPAVEIPAISARYFWDSMAATYSSTWYDLCPDGTVRRPDGAEPCAGFVLGDTSSGSAFRGWKLSGDNWDKDDDEFDGVYYAYGRNIKVGGNPGAKNNQPDWRATLFADTGNVACGGTHGDIEISGNPEIVNFLPSIILVSSRDFVVSGSPRLETGILASREQFRISGNPNVLGAVISQDECNTAGSPVSDDDDRVNGNPTITNNGGLDVNLTTLVRTTLWLEL